MIIKKPSLNNSLPIILENDKGIWSNFYAAFSLANSNQTVDQWKFFHQINAERIRELVYHYYVNSNKIIQIMINKGCQNCQSKWEFFNRRIGLILLDTTRSGTTRSATLTGRSTQQHLWNTFIKETSKKTKLWT